MKALNYVMPRFVALLAIRGWADLIIKSVIFYVIFLGLSIPFVVSETGTFSWKSFIEDAGLTLAVSTPILIFQFSVVTYLDRLQKQLARLAMTDVLTGLPNRRSFLNDASDALAGSHGGVVIVLDADHFKRINDTYGHAVGDACLQAIAQRLNSAVRDTDVVARLGGEEFGAFLPGATTSRVVDFGDEMTRPITVSHADVGEDVVFTLSLGAAQGDSAQTLHKLLTQADFALYEAKNAGRARLVIWHPGLDAMPIEKAG